MKVVEINSKPEVKEPLGYITISYTNDTEETLQVDSFGVAQELPDFITLWSEEKEGPVGFLNIKSIKKIITIQNIGVMEEDEYNS